MIPNSYFILCHCYSGKSVKKKNCQHHTKIKHLLSIYELNGHIVLPLHKVEFDVTCIETMLKTDLQDVYKLHFIYQKASPHAELQRSRLRRI